MKSGGLLQPLHPTARHCHCARRAEKYCAATEEAQLNLRTDMTRNLREQDEALYKEGRLMLVVAWQMML